VHDLTFPAFNAAAVHSEFLSGCADRGHAGGDWIRGRRSANSQFATFSGDGRGNLAP